MENPIDLSSLLIKDVGFKPGECAGKVVVITGAGQGIGYQAARAFAALGGIVVLAEISKETGKAAEAAINAQGGKALFVQTDVSDTWSVKRLAQAVQSVFGRVDILINNAIRCPSVPIIEMDEVLWDQVMAVNLRGTFLICKAFLPEMLERHQGVILNMVSVDAMPGLSAYIASKQGILGFSQTLALEVGPAGVRVIAFGPGMVDTPGIRSISADLAPRLGMTQEQFMHIPLHAAYDGLMPAEHAGAAAVYLALRLADEFQGQMVNGYEVLERAGLIKPAPLIPTSAATKSPPAPMNTAKSGEVQQQVGKVVEIVAATGKEFEKLPVFVRPMTRSGFKGKSGQSLENWQRTLSALQEKLGQNSSEGAQAVLPGLDKLIEYYRGTPHEMARFTRDQELLRQAAKLAGERIAEIQKLQAGLRGMIEKS